MSNTGAEAVPPPPVTTATAANPTTAQEETASGGMDQSVSTTVSSMADLKTQAPQVYNAMMQGIGMNICNDMQHHQDQLKQLMDEYSRS